MSGVCGSYKNKKWHRKPQERLWGPNRRTLSGWKIQRTRGHIQSYDQPHSQVGVSEALNNTNEEYLQLHFIPSLHSERILVFETYLHRSNVMVQISHQLPHLNFPIGEGPKLSYMYSLNDTGAGLNLVNLDYHQSVAERHPNLVLKFSHLKDLEDVDPFNISGVDGGK